MPTEDTIHANENFEYALSAAPNVLYQRYMQYGQVGGTFLSFFFYSTFMLEHSWGFLDGVPNLASSLTV
jgi:hypothetical protein